MDGQTSDVKKVRVGELYDRLVALDKKHGAQAWRWYNIAMRGVGVLFAIALVLLPFLWLLNSTAVAHLRSAISALLVTISMLVGVAVLAVAVVALKKAWSPFKRHSRDFDRILSYERELIVDFRQYAAEDLKEVAARLEVDLKTATRRMNIFTICAAISSLCIVVFGKDQSSIPAGFDASLIPWLFALFVLMSGFAGLMVIAMAAQLERMSFILTRAADVPKS